MTEIEDRRQTALEAGYDADDNGTFEGYSHGSLKVAIETATRVRITPEIESAALSVLPEGEQFPVHYFQMIEAAFKAAGFEVED